MAIGHENSGILRFLQDLWLSIIWPDCFRCIVENLKGSLFAGWVTDGF